MDTSKPSLKRTKIACEECRKNKRKCDGQQPTCGLCLRARRICEYAAESYKRKRKRWNDDYVHDLEGQVIALTRLVDAANAREIASGSPSGCFTEDNSYSTDAQAVDGVYANNEKKVVGHVDILRVSDVDQVIDVEKTGADLRSVSAMEELGSLMLKLGLKDEGEPSFTIATTNARLPRFGKDRSLDPTESSMRGTPRTQVPVVFLDPMLRSHLFERFRILFNNFHQIFDPEELAKASTDNPYFQRDDVLFRNMAAMAIGARYSDREDAETLSLAAAEYAESMAWGCLKFCATPLVVQGLSLLSWLELMLGNDMACWNFNSSATGLGLRLGLHVTALSDGYNAQGSTTRETYCTRVRAFWSYFSIDRMITAVIGMNCTMPWQRVRVEPFLGIINVEYTTDEIAFSRTGELWHLWDSFMDQMYAFDWANLSSQGKQSLLTRSYQALLAFHSDCHPVLRGAPIEAAESVVCFQLAYHTAVLLVHRPFLGDPVNSQTRAIALQAATDAAMSICRILREVLKRQTPCTLPPQTMNYIVCAAVIHLLNATCGRTSLGRRSSSNLKLCMEALIQVGPRWKCRQTSSIRFIQELAQKWKVVWALPLQFSFPLNTEGFDENHKIDTIDNSPTDRHYTLRNDVNMSLPNLELSHFGLDQLAPLDGPTDPPVLEWLFNSEEVVP